MRRYQNLEFAEHHGGVVKPRAGWDAPTTKRVQRTGEACAMMNQAKGSLGRIHHPECKILLDKAHPGKYKGNVYMVSLKWALKTRRQFVSHHGCCYKKQQDPQWAAVRDRAYQDLREEIGGRD